MERLTSAFRDNLAFPYKQSALLKKVRKLRGSEGVCYGIYSDWLARHLTGAVDLQWTTSGVHLYAPPNYVDGRRVAFRKVDHAYRG